MTIWRILMLSAGALATSSIGGHAGPCSDEIYRMEARLRPRAPKPFSTASQHRARSPPPKAGSVSHRRKPSTRSRRLWRARAKRMVSMIWMPASGRWRTCKAQSVPSSLPNRFADPIRVPAPVK
jgi:hypothetical protein